MQNKNKYYTCIARAHLLVKEKAVMFLNLCLDCLEGIRWLDPAEADCPTRGALHKYLHSVRMGTQQFLDKNSFIRLYSHAQKRQ